MIQLSKRGDRKNHSIEPRYILYNFLDDDMLSPKGWIQQVGNNWYGCGEGAGWLRGFAEGVSFADPQNITDAVIRVFSSECRTYDLISGSEDITDAEVKVAPDNTVYELC